MIKEKIAIIVPIYNVEKYVAKCLDSLISQTYQNIEIWAIIDGSLDHSVDIVLEYAKKDSRIKCIEKENGGYGSVLEYAIENISTRYFMICDPDDWLSNDALEVLVKNALKYDSDIVVADKYLVYSNNYEEEYSSSIDFDFFIEPYKVYTGEDIGKFSLLCVTPHSKLFKTSVAKGISFPKKVSYTDFLLYIVSLCNSKRVVYVDRALSYYLIDREGNTMTDVSRKAMDSHFVVYDEIIRQLRLKSVVNPYIYLRLYNEYRYILLDLASRMSVKDYNMIKRELPRHLFLIKDYKDVIKKLCFFKSKIKTLYNRMICSLLFGRLTCFFITQFLVKFFRKRR